MVLDAVAMWIVSDGSFSQPVILTPHAGEMAQLTGHPKERVCVDRHMAAVYAAWQWNTCLALKGAETFIATPEEDAWHFTGGGSGLATSGSGDALAGLIGGLAARGMVPLAAARGVSCFTPARGTHCLVGTGRWAILQGSWLANCQR